MELKLIIIILVIAFQIFAGIVRGKAKKNLVEPDEENHEPAETEIDIPEIFRTFFQTEEKQGNVREGSNLPPPVPDMPIVSELEQSPRNESYGDFAGYGDVAEDLPNNFDTVEVKEVKKVNAPKKIEKRRTEQPNIMKNFDLQKAIIYSEIMSPKFKDY